MINRSMAPGATAPGAIEAQKLECRQFSENGGAMFAKLLSSRRFAPLFWCQFFSAFNDNFLKNSLVFLILFKLSGADSEALITLAGAIFIFPFFILSALGGEIADRFDKALIARRLKFTE